MNVRGVRGCLSSNSSFCSGALMRRFLRPSLRDRPLPDEDDCLSSFGGGGGGGGSCI